MLSRKKLKMYKRTTVKGTVMAHKVLFSPYPRGYYTPLNPATVFHAFTKLESKLLHSYGGNAAL